MTRKDRLMGRIAFGSMWLIICVGTINYVAGMVNGNQLRIVDACHLSRWWLVLFLTTPGIPLLLLARLLLQTEVAEWEKARDSYLTAYPILTLVIAITWSTPFGFRPIESSYDFSQFFFKYTCSLVFLVTGVFVAHKIDQERATQKNSQST